MRRRALAMIGAAGLLVSAWSATAGSQEVAVMVTDVGWWTSNPAASAPAGGFAVSAGPNGTVISQAAVRFSVLATDLDRAVLTIREAGGAAAAGAALQVCPTPNAWVPVEKGDPAKAPKPECDRGSAELERDASTAVWSADVRSLLSAADDGPVSLMVVPAGAGAVPLGFEVRFERPSVDAAGSSSSSSSSSDGDSFASPSSTGSSSSDSDADASFSSPSFSSSAAPSAPLPSFGGAGTFVADSGAESALPPAVETGVAAVDEAAAGPVPVRRVTPTPVGGSGGSRGVQALFFLVVATLIGVGVGLGHARFRPTTT